MRSDAGERNRELIEKSAALLSADYPLEVLIEQLCNAIAEDMDASVFVALPKQSDSVRIYSVNRGDRRWETGEQLMPEDSELYEVLRSGRARVIKDASDEGESSMLSRLYVPISYGEIVLGVMGVMHEEPSRFSRDDLRVVESMARHLAMAIRNDQTLALARRRTRYPWLPIAAVLAVAVIVTVVARVWPAASAVVVWILALLAIVALHVTAVVRRNAAALRERREELQSEIVDRLDVEERLRAAAFHDGMTGLPNRAFFLQQLRAVVEQRQQDELHAEYAVLFIDLDRFYVVNDTLGHAIGDQVLAAVAYRLEESIPPHALIARLGGDEFVLLLPAQDHAISEAIAIAEDVLDALRNPFRVGAREVYTGASIGIVKIDESYDDSESILRDADISMYHAKRTGRARYAVFDQAMRQRLTQQLDLEDSLRGAVDRGEIVAFYQPIIRVSDEQIVGFEALARWYRDGEDQTVAAGEFVPVAELSGMMRAIDAELFAQVCRDVAELTTIAPGLRVSVNVSANDLTRASLLADIDSTLQRFSVSPQAIRIEITETAVMEDAERALTTLGELQARGLEMVVDDFGAGYSSLSYLQRLPLGGVKIDRSFIVSLPGDPQALEIVRAIVALAKALGLHVTAEGVEREEQFELLRLLGVEYAQGYWFSPPVDFESAKAFFAVRS